MVNIIKTSVHHEVYKGKIRVEKKVSFNFACKCEIIDPRFQMRFKYIVNIPNLKLGQIIKRWGLFLSHNNNFLGVKV